MRSFKVPGGLGAKLATAATMAALIIQAGCESSTPPSVSGSRTEVTVQGKVTYKGQPVTEGEISFDPANIQRRDAAIVTSQIGKDGSYTVKTLQGENTVRFKVPQLSKTDFAVTSASFPYDAPAGESTKDFDITPK